MQSTFLPVRQTHSGVFAPAHRGGEPGRHTAQKAASFPAFGRCQFA